MSSKNHTILLIEDTLTLSRLYDEFMQREGYSVVAVSTGREGLDYLTSTIRTRPSAIVLDLFLPDMNGLDILVQVQRDMPEIPVIVVTINNSIDVAVDAMRKGAYDYIVKPFSAQRLTTTLANALRHKTMESEISKLRQLTTYDNFYNFVGKSPAMVAVYRAIEVVAASSASVFIEGEMGTGKEMAALAIHKASPRREKPFITLNCAAIPAELMEGTLFGYSKGAFNGAISDHPGAARSAHGGTLFLKNINEMPLELQAKLLRFLQTGEVSPMGTNRVEMVDTRVIASTNRKAIDEVRAGRIREDLFYRLYVATVEMPPLQERDDDILILASHFMAKYSAVENKSFTSLSPDVQRAFRLYNWPGNVRQLESVIHHVIVLHFGRTIEFDMLPKDFMPFAAAAPAQTTGPNLTVVEGDKGDRDSTIWPLWMVEKHAILAALDYVGHDIPRAAALLEISPTTLNNKLQMWRAANNPGSARHAS